QHHAPCRPAGPADPAARQDEPRLRHRADEPADAVRAQRPPQAGAMKKLRLLALMDEVLVPPDDPKDVDVTEAEWKTEFDVVTTLRNLGHEVQCLGVGSDLGVVRNAIAETQPHAVF